MSETIRNIGLFFILLSVCFMVKCKLDSDKVSQQQEVKEKTSLVNKVKTSEESIAKKKALEETIEKEKALNIAQQEKALIENKKQEEALKTKEVKAQTAVSKKSVKPKIKRQAKIEFEELSWDMGELIEGDIRKKKFKFTNTGNAPLQIIGATATCGCATPTVPFLDIAPGESNSIGVQYNSVSKEGDQFPEVTIESNTYPKYTVLKLSASVTPKPKEDKESKEDASKQDSTSNQ